PRLTVQRRDPDLHASGRRQLRPDDRHGHPRPDRGGVLPPRGVPQRRPDRRRAARSDCGFHPRQDANAGQLSMWKLTRKGLIANKLRFLLTGIAVVLGVAFVSGTFVLTATIQKTFDDLFTNIYSNTDSVVRAREVLSSDFGSGDRP